MALQALAKYGAATYSAEGGTTVAVTSLGGLNKEFTVDQSNRLLYQEAPLSEVPGEYVIRAAGQSCVLAQVRPAPHLRRALRVWARSLRVWARSRTPREPSLSSDLRPLQHPAAPRLLRLQHLRPRRGRVQRQPAAARPLRARPVPGPAGGDQHGHRQRQAAVRLRAGPELAGPGGWGFNGGRAAPAADRANARVFLQLRYDRSVKRVDVEDGYVNAYVDGVRTGAP